MLERRVADLEERPHWVPIPTAPAPNMPGQLPARVPTYEPAPWWLNPASPPLVPMCDTTEPRSKS